MKKSDEELKKDAEKLIEKFSLPDDARVDETPEAYRQRKRIEADARAYNENHKIKVWS